MTAAPDPLEALVTFLAANETISTLTATLVFGDEVPPKKAASIPFKCVVIGASGGAGTIGAGYQEYGDQRFDVRSYGETPLEAARLQLVVYAALKQLRREVHAGVLLHWATRSGGPISLREPDTDWPFRFESYQVLSSEVEVT